MWPGAVDGERRVGRGLLPPLRPDVHVMAVRVAQPESAVGRPARRIDLAHTRPAHRFPDRLDVAARRAERQVVKALPGSAVEQGARATEPAGMEMHRTVPRRPVDEPERPVERLSDRLVGHLERVVEQRSNRHRGPPSVRAGAGLRPARRHSVAACVAPAAGGGTGAPAERRAPRRPCCGLPLQRRRSSWSAAATSGPIIPGSHRPSPARSGNTGRPHPAGIRLQAAPIHPGSPPRSKATIVSRGHVEPRGGQDARSGNPGFDGGAYVA